MTKPDPYAAAAQHGLMDGSPPFSDGHLVTLANLQDPPFNRWAFQHLRDLIPTARIRRGDGRIRHLPRDERDLTDLRFRFGRRTYDLERFLRQTWTDGFLVLHRGRIVMERYENGLTPDTPHLLMSVSKSITAAIAGVLVGRGVLDPENPVTDVVHELRGTSFDGATVQHLLDMRTGTRFNEDYDDPDADVRRFEQIYLWRPRTDPELPEDAHAYFATLRNDGEHGGPFRYRSVLTDVLGWVVERAGGARLAELASRELWQPMGAEFDAEVTVDAHGNAMADGGMCVTLRDLGRFGQLYLDRGRRGRRRILPAGWIDDTIAGAPDGAQAYLDGEGERDHPQGAHYRNKWWILDPDLPFLTGSGINGQHVYVHGPSRTVVAKLSSWPVASEPGLWDLTTTAVAAIAGALADRPPDPVAAGIARG